MSNTSKALSKLIKQFEPAVEKALDKISKVAQDHARATNLFKGHVLKDNIIILKNGALARTVLANKDYAGYVEYGNNQQGPYIYPVRAKALRFFVNGTEVFTKRVRSHGPIPFMQAASEYAESKSTEIIEKILGELLK